MGLFGHPFSSLADRPSSSTSARNQPEANDFERHEIKTYQRKGDQVRSEYERLNPDGTVTKSVAYGNIKEGLKYRTYQMFQDGTVREVAPEQNLAPPPPPPRAVAPPPPPQQPQQQSVEPRKYTFVVEPKSSSPGQRTWRIRTVQDEKKVKPEAPRQEKASPWWYETVNEAFKETPRQEERPKPRAIEEPQPKSKKNIFDVFDDDFFFMKPKQVFKAPKVADPFEMLENSFDKSFFGDVSKCPFLSSF